MFKEGLPPPTAFPYVSGTESFHESITGDVKHEIVSRISTATGLDYEAVNSVVRQWADSSNDTDYKSLSMQEVAAKTFGTELSEWQKGKITKLMDPEAGYSDGSKEHALQYTHTPYRTPQAATEAILREMHSTTQDYFKEKGVKTVILYRGVRNKLPGSTVGEKVNLKSNALESWTVEPLIAKSFADNVIKAEVPVERILSTSRTGFGCLNEYECVVIGNKEGDVAEIYGLDPYG